MPQLAFYGLPQECYHNLVYNNYVLHASNKA